MLNCMKLQKMRYEFWYILYFSSQLTVMTNIPCISQSALYDLCHEKEKGRLLESCIILRRALQSRMWEIEFDSIYFQCPGVSDSTKKTLVSNHLIQLPDVYGKSPPEIQKIAHCSLNDANRLIEFTDTCMANSLNVRSVVTDGKIKFAIDAHTHCDTPITRLCPKYELISYDSITGRLIIFRKLPLGTKHIEYIVPFPKETAEPDVKTVLLSSYVGMDQTILPRDVQAPQQAKKSRAKPEKSLKQSVIKRPQEPMAESKKRKEMSSEVYGVFEHETPTPSSGKQNRTMDMIPTSQNLGVSRGRPLFDQNPDRFDEFRCDHQSFTNMPYNITQDQSPRHTGGVQGMCMDSDSSIRPSLSSLRYKANELQLGSVPTTRFRRSVPSQSNVSSGGTSMYNPPIDLNSSVSISPNSFATMRSEKGTPQPNTDVSVSEIVTHHENSVAESPFLPRFFKEKTNLGAQNEGLPNSLYEDAFCNGSLFPLITGHTPGLPLAHQDRGHILSNSQFSLPASCKQNSSVIKVDEENLHLEDYGFF